MQGFSQPDLDSFFDIDPGHGVLAQIFKSDANGNIELDAEGNPTFLRKVNVLFESSTQEISLYPESNAEASDPFMLIKLTDTVGIKRGFRVNFPDAVPPAECAGKTYEVTPRNSGEDVQTMRFHLNPL